ncbi:MAG: hypothetical protein IT384_08865 [Deltaproteobacteria bacterium]|nr:hypothetical protein [Deltaproteobacteria bacterium]
MRAQVCLQLILPALIGCAATGTRPHLPPTMIALLPLARTPTTAEIPIDPETTIRESLRPKGEIELRSERRVHDALKKNPKCQEDLTCLRGLGAELEANKLITGRIAVLGSTALLRLSLIDVALGTQQDTKQTLVKSVTAQHLRESLGALCLDLVRPLAPPLELEPEPWYGRWWFWAISGTLAAGAATTVVILSTRAGGPVPDHVITPP